MFGREFMIRTDNRTLKETPDVLDSVGMDITPNPFLRTMVDCLVPSIMVSDTIVRRPIISVDSLSIRGGMGFNEVVECLAVSSTNNLHPKRTTTLNSTDNGSLIPFVTMPYIPSLATYKGLVNFNDTIKGFGVMLGHSIPYPVAKIPGCLVRYSYGAFNLVSRYTLLSLRHHVSGKKPLPQGKVGVMEDSASSNGELIAT